MEQREPVNDHFDSAPVERGALCGWALQRVVLELQALDFVQQTVSVYTVSWLWTQLSRASRQHWEALASHDPARNDVRAVLASLPSGSAMLELALRDRPALLREGPWALRLQLEVSVACWHERLASLDQPGVLE